MRDRVPRLGETNQVMEPANNLHLVLEVSRLLIYNFVVFPHAPLKLEFKFRQRHWIIHLDLLVLFSRVILLFWVLKMRGKVDLPEVVSMTVLILSAIFNNDYKIKRSRQCALPNYDFRQFFERSVFAHSLCVQVVHLELSTLAYKHALKVDSVTFAKLGEH